MTDTTDKKTDITDQKILDWSNVKLPDGVESLKRAAPDSNSFKSLKSDTNTDADANKSQRERDILKNTVIYLVDTVTKIQNTSNIRFNFGGNSNPNKDIYTAGVSKLNDVKNVIDHTNGIVVDENVQIETPIFTR